MRVVFFSGSPIERFGRFGTLYAYHASEKPRAHELSTCIHRFLSALLSGCQPHECNVISYVKK